MSQWIKSVHQKELRLFHLINHHMKCGFFDHLLPRVTHLGGAAFTSLVTILLILGGGRFREAGLLSGATLIISGVLVFIMKRLCVRPRPFDALDKLHVIDHGLTDYSFPSGHSTASAAVATSLAMAFPTFGVYFLLIAIIVAVSRVYIGVHYPLDILVGLFIGAFLAYLLSPLFVVNQIVELI